MAGIAGAAPLTLSSPTNGKLESGNAALKWSESISELQSWELTFTLDDASLANASLFGTRRDGFEAGIVLNVRADGGFMIFNKKTGSDANNNLIEDNTFEVSTDAGWVTAGVKTSVTLSYVADVNTTGSVVGGTFTITSGENTKTIVMNNADLLVYTSLKNDEGTRFYTDGGKQKFYDISVSQLSNRVVPEPATATLSLLALCGLAARRRRK